tara:strand:+ start:417 stop:851 length:435 start_codon:yes stop_codon:yes gene_type:complete
MIDLLRAYEDFTWENFASIGKELSKINADNLTQELVQHPMIFQQYMSLISLSKKELDQASSSLNLISSRLRKEHKQFAQLKKLTAKDLDDLVFTDDEYIEADKKVIEATHKYLTIKGMVSALEHKKDILVQLSANSRSETKLYN